MDSQDITNYVIENQFSNPFFWIFMAVILYGIYRALTARP